MEPENPIFHLTEREINWLRAHRWWEKLPAFTKACYIAAAKLDANDFPTGNMIDNILTPENMISVYNLFGPGKDVPANFRKA